MLDRAIELLATIDIPGELELPLELVSTAQSSARAGLASLRRVEDALDSVEITHRADGAGHAGAPRPVPPAQWLVYWASRLLPVGSRERYGEEFRGELRELADAGEGARAQLAYALRQLARIGALRRALPPTPRPAESDRVRAHPLADDAPAPRLRTRKSVDQRRAHRRVRVVVREEPQPPPPYFERRPSPNQDDDVRRNGRHRRRR